MARIRTIKPEFFTSEDIVACSPLARLLFQALWCEADKQGRFRWRPTTFKLRYLPGDDCDVRALLDELLERRLVVRYQADGLDLAYVPTWHRHQFVNNREQESSLPAPPEGDASPRVPDASVTRDFEPATRDDACSKEGKGKEGKGREGNTHDARATDDHAPAAVVAFDSQWGASPARRHPAGNAWQSTIGKPVKAFLHAEFSDSLANAGDPNPDATLRAWYAATEDAMQGKRDGRDALVFWRAEFAAWQGGGGNSAEVQQSWQLSEAERAVELLRQRGRAQA